MSTMSYIQEGLYLGDLQDAYQSHMLRDKGVTHILTVNAKPLEREFTEGFEYKFVHALDMESTDLLSHFDECLSFIAEGRKKGGIFVHCYFGQSRSATLVLAHLMNTMDLTLDDAKSLLMCQRKQIRPNHGFLQQLELFESMGSVTDKSHPQFKLYRLNLLTQQMKAAQIQGALPDDAFSVDPSTASSQNQIIYKCKKCRRPLLGASSVIPHAVGRGQAAFDWRAKLPSSQFGLEGDEDESNCTQSLFTEPISWMADQILVLEGKLQCPKCFAKLGSFNWSGERCPCGTWITPAFHVQTSKVDKCPPRILPKISIMNRKTNTGQSSQSLITKLLPSNKDTELDLDNLTLNDLPPLE